MGSPCWIPVARRRCRADRPTPKPFPVLLRPINRGKSASFGLQALSAMKAGRMGGAARGPACGVERLGARNFFRFLPLSQWGAKDWGALERARWTERVSLRCAAAGRPRPGEPHWPRRGAKWARVRPKPMRRRRSLKSGWGIERPGRLEICRFAEILFCLVFGARFGAPPSAF